jgi:metal-responsive CopG/Arc/MetJ family transcriptional regulator
LTGVIPRGILNGRKEEPPEGISMPTVKTAISLPEPLFHRAETVAHELQISRSQLVAKAVDEFVKRYERRALLEAVNRAYEEEPPTAEEKELLQGIRKQQQKLLESDR